MSASGPEPFVAEQVSLAWREQPDGPAFTAACRFETGAIRHVIQKHFGGHEPWTRILAGSLVARLAEAGRRRLPPAAADLRAFVAAVGEQIQACCNRPRLCVFLEVALHYVDDKGRLRQNFQLQKREKILLLLQSGAVAFVEVTNPLAPEPSSAVFRTAFFPRCTRWVVPRRAAEASMAHYVARWAEGEHHTGGLRLPEPWDGVRERDDETGVEKQREYFRFATPETWGFERQADGAWVWFEP